MDRFIQKNKKIIKPKTPIPKKIEYELDSETKKKYFYECLYW